MGESHRGVSSAQRKLIEEPLKQQKTWVFCLACSRLHVTTSDTQTTFANSPGRCCYCWKETLPWGLCVRECRQHLCGFCFPASSSVSARSRHVRSFVAGAINSLQCAAPVVLPFADTPGASLVYMPTLHVVEKYWHCQSAAHCSWTWAPLLHLRCQT